MPSRPRTGLVELTANAWAVVLSIIPPEGGGPNVGFIMAGDQVLVIDSSMSPSSGRQVANYLRQVTDRPPAYLINTHHHGDHVLGNQAFSPPATIIAHENVRQALLAQGPAIVKSFAERFSDLLPDIKDSTVLPPHITYREHMALHLAGHTIELIHPGLAHTNGDTLVYLPDEKVLFAGDLLFNHIFPPIYGSSAGWISALEQMEAMDIRAVVPGHGAIATKKELGDLRRFLIELRRQVKDCLARRLSPEQATREIDLTCLDWPRSDRLGQDVEVIYGELKEAAGGQLLELQPEDGDEGHAQGQKPAPEV